MANEEIKFNDLGGKIKEVIDEESETKYLDFVFEMFTYDLDIQGEDKKEIYNIFIDDFYDLYNSIKIKGIKGREAKYKALYQTTQKYLSKENCEE